MNARLWDARSLAVTPSGHGKSYKADVDGPSGERLASVEGGTLRDASGTVLLEAPLRWDKSGKRFALEFIDTDGEVLAEAKAVKTSTGPRSTKATVAVTDRGGVEVLRAEPDKKGEQVRVLAGGAPVATINISTVKTGLLRKSRLYAVEVNDGIQADLRPLVVALGVRYDAVLNAVKAAGAD